MPDIRFRLQQPPCAAVEDAAICAAHWADRIPPPPPVPSSALADGWYQTANPIVYHRASSLPGPALAQGGTWHAVRVDPETLALEVA